jgi:type II pantothenate kinase
MYNVCLACEGFLAVNNVVYLLTGSLAKLVYFTKDDDHFVDGEAEISPRKTSDKPKGSSRNLSVLKGRLNFKKFETSKINDCIDFIKTMKLHLGGE